MSNEFAQFVAWTFAAIGTQVVALGIWYVYTLKTGGPHVGHD